MTPLLLDGPATEPLSLADMKAHLRLDASDAGEDALITSLIMASRLLVEAHAARLLITQTWRLVLDAWPERLCLRVPLGPLQRISAARIIDDAGDARDLDLSLLTLDRLANPARIRIDPSVPMPGARLNGIEIDVVAGYGDLPVDVPAPLTQAIRLLATRWFEHRGDMPNREEPALPGAIAALIAPYRRVRL